MIDPLLESDLADLVEGRLPADRREVVRAALERDPALVRRVEAMIADRKLMASSLSHRQGSAGNPGGVGAPAGLVAGALRRASAEPAGMDDGEGPSSRPWKLLPMAVAAALLVGVAGTWYLATRPGPTGLPGDPLDTSAVGRALAESDAQRPRRPGALPRMERALADDTGEPAIAGVPLSEIDALVTNQSTAVPLLGPEAPIDALVGGGGGGDPLWDANGMSTLTAEQVKQVMAELAEQRGGIEELFLEDGQKRPAVRFTVLAADGSIAERDAEHMLRLALARRLGVIVRSPSPLRTLDALAIASERRGWALTDRGVIDPAAVNADLARQRDGWDGDAAAPQGPTSPIGPPDEGVAPAIPGEADFRFARFLTSVRLPVVGDVRADRIERSLDSARTVLQTLIGGRTDVLFVEIGSSAAPEPMWSLEPADVLWWTGRPAEYAGEVLLRLPVVVVAAPSGDEPPAGTTPDDPGR